MKSIRLTATTVAAATAIALAPAASADPAPYTGVELNQPASQTVAVEARFNLTDDEEYAMAELRRLRGSMWDRNMPLDGKGLQQWVPNRSAYVDGISYDAGYALIALQRAVEEQHILGIGMDHQRPYNSTSYSRAGDVFTATINGRSGAENLHSTASIREAMRGWGIKEAPALRAANGSWNTSNGHLHSLLNPANKYVGFASVFTLAGESSAAIVGTRPTGVALRQDQKGSQKQVLYRPANGNEKPSADAQSLGPLASSEMSPQQIYKIIAIILGVLSAGQAIWRFAQPYLPR